MLQKAVNQSNLAALKFAKAFVDGPAVPGTDAVFCCHCVRSFRSMLCCYQMQFEDLLLTPATQRKSSRLIFSSSLIFTAALSSMR